MFFALREYLFLLFSTLVHKVYWSVCVCVCVRARASVNCNMCVFARARARIFYALSQLVYMRAHVCVSI